jgi:hypothetical protein
MLAGTGLLVLVEMLIGPQPGRPGRSSWRAEFPGQHRTVSAQSAAGGRASTLPTALLHSAIRAFRLVPRGGA